MQPETKEKLQQHPLWSKLSLQQQEFISTFIESQDEVEAVKKAYVCNSEKSAKTQASRLLRDWKIQNVLSYMGVSTQGALVSKQEARQLISTRLRSTDTDAGAFVKLLQAYERLSGWESVPSKDEESESADIDEQVRAIEKAKRQGNG